MIKIGTVGTNFIVDWFIDAVSKIDNLQVTAVYSRTEDRAKEFALKHGIEKHYSDRESFLKDSSLDFIYVASPNSLHYKWSIDAMLAGRNVICEKPFVSTLSEAAELAKTAKEKRLFLFEAITVPHLPNYREAKKHLADLGKIKIAQLNFSKYSSRYDAFLDGEITNVFNPDFSGGALMDINYYNLYFLYGFFGKPNEIHYFPNIAQNGIDTSGVLVMQYDGFVCTAVGTKDSKSENKVQIQGEKGYMQLPFDSSWCSSVIIKPNNGEQKVIDYQTETNVLYYELKEFAEIYVNKDYLRRNELLKCSVEVTELVESCRKKAGILFPADRNK